MYILFQSNLVLIELFIFLFLSVFHNFLLSSELKIDSLQMC